MNASFRNLKVLELASVLAGPSVGMFLRELGAQVTKIEAPKGDVTRTWKSSDEWPGKSVSAYYASINFDKEVIVLDLKDPQQRAQLDPLIAEADILIENYRSDSRARLGLSPDHISALNPSIIHAHLGGFESNEARVAYDVVVQAETGFMSMNGEAHGGPNKMPVALMDVLAAHQLKEGILAALYHRALTGEGGYLSCSLEMAGIVSLVNQSANYLNHGKIAQRIGSLHPNIAPYGETFPCADGKEIVLAIGSHTQFKSLCSLLGEAKWAADERFSNNAARLKNRKVLQDLLREKFKGLDSFSFLSECEAANIPAGAIRNVGEVMELEQSKNAVLIDEEDGIELKRIKSIAFTYSPFVGSITS